MPSADVGWPVPALCCLDLNEVLGAKGLVWSGFQPTPSHRNSRVGDGQRVAGQASAGVRVI
jgi:hypothetical protein